MQTFYRAINEKTRVCIIALTLLYLAVFLWDLPNNATMNVRNSDAPWHTLLIAQAMEETPVSVHKLLPIVTLGGKENKNIPWGDCLADENGNYYYTSFMPLSFIIPWLFLKLPGLQINELSLSILTGILGLASSILLFFLLRAMYGRYFTHSTILLYLAAFYFLAPELLHCNADIYWGQNLYQPLLIGQLFWLYRYLESSGKNRRFWLLLLTAGAFAAACIEWTAYVMNAALALCICLKAIMEKRGRKEENGEKKRKSAAGCISACFLIALASLAALALLGVHYSLVLEPAKIRELIGKRALVRSLASEGNKSFGILAEYLHSFSMEIGAVVILAGICFMEPRIRGALRKEALGNRGLVTLAAGTACLENLLMSEHALEYSYDRMKVGVWLLLLFFLLLYTMKKVGEWSFLLQRMLVIFACCVMLLELTAFHLPGNGYRWTVDGDYRNNEILAAALRETYGEDNSVYGQAPVIAVRGYDTLLFHRNIYEGKKLEELEGIAAKQGKRYVIFLIADNEAWQKSLYYGAVVSDLENKERVYWEMGENGEIGKRILDKNGCYAAAYMDGVTEEPGVFTDLGVVRFELTQENRSRLEHAAALSASNGVSFPVTGVFCWDEIGYIDVQLQVEESLREQMAAFRFPNELQILYGGEE